MILGISIGAFTILHVIITLVAIGSGLIVVGGMFASHRLPVTTALFLFTTALTSVTGFLFPIHGFTPALGVGILACVILLIALFALYEEHLVGAWRWIYVIAAVASLYLNVFVLVVQSFVKVFGSHCVGSDADRATLRNHTSRCTGHFRSDYADRTSDPQIRSLKVCGAGCWAADVPELDRSLIAAVQFARGAPTKGKKKAARSPLFEAGGKRRRTPAGAEGAPRGAPAGASA
jgi:hypothetical protein